MHALRGGIPRALGNHRTASGHAYRTYCAAIIARFEGRLPKDLQPTLREAGRIVLDLERLNRELEVARTRRDQSRARRHLRTARRQLFDLEARLETRMTTRPVDPFAAVRRAVDEANGR